MKKVKFNLEPDNVNDNQNQNLQKNEKKQQKKNKQLEHRKSIERKFNKQNMIVAVRARPLNQREIEFSNIETVMVNSNREMVTVLDPVEYSFNSNGNVYINNEHSITISKSKEYQYAFDFAFDQKAQQEEVYVCTTEFLLQGVIDGFNATVFAYGATGSGKTFTMVGNGENPGVMVRSISDLFSLIEKQQKSKFFSIQISYVEIYNETLMDLLSDTNDENVEMRNDPQMGMMLVGARCENVTNPNEVFMLLIKGNKKRREAPTMNNECSSRSHAILQVHLEMKDKINEITFGKFILVDLAGSEKISSVTKSAIESGSINKSLLALANCINSLVSASESQSKSFIPWRDSKLTRLLKVNF